MKDRDYPFDRLEEIRTWVERNRPTRNKAQVAAAKEHRETTKAIALLERSSVPVPRELQDRIDELEKILNAPDEHEDFMNHLADRLIDLGKQIRSQYRGHGSTAKSPRKRLSVTLPDGATLSESTAVETFIRTLQYMGMQKCAQITDVQIFGHPVVSRRRNERAINAKLVYGYYVETNTSTDTKVSMLEQYANRLGLRLRIEVD